MEFNNKINVKSLEANDNNNKIDGGKGTEEDEESDGPIKDAILGFVGSFNKYATKKTAGQGLLDFALLAANVSKLQALFKRSKRDAVFYVLVVAICVSLAIQVVVGVLMAILGKMKMASVEERRRANFLNNLITVLLAILTVINVVISVVDVSGE